jgi:uncharacterized protein YggE
MRIVSMVLAAFMIMLPFHAAAESSKDIRKISVSGKAEKTLEAHRATIRLSIKHVKPEMNQSHATLMETLSRLTRELSAWRTKKSQDHLFCRALNILGKRTLRS